jgi:hypothetical protein
MPEQGPNPGPQHRLLKKSPDENLKQGDEAYDIWGDKEWVPSYNAAIGSKQGKEIWYRRRIDSDKQ